MSYVRPLITAVLFVLLYLPVFPQLTREWIDNSSFSHGFLVPPLSMYFLWLRKDELKKTVISASGYGIAIMCAGIALYIVATQGYQLFFQCLSMVVVLFGIVYAHSGAEMAKKAAFAIGYLVLMIPIPTIAFNTITYHMRVFSANITYFILGMLGISATIRENVINLTTCSIEVTSSCSGFRGITVFTAASLALGYIYHNSLKKRSLLFAIGLALAVMLNIIRIVLEAVIVDVAELASLPPFLDQAAGVSILIVGLILLFWINDNLKAR